MGLLRKSIAGIIAGLSTCAMLTPALATVEAAAKVKTATPVKHLVVIFQENVSFDHYFATYPHATNPSGEPRFVAEPGTPSIDGLRGLLLTANPNATNKANA